MPIDAKHEDLQSLRIDRSERGTGNGQPTAWARRYIVIGIVVVAVLSLSVLAYRLLARDVPEVEVVRASAENSEVGGTVLSSWLADPHLDNIACLAGRYRWPHAQRLPTTPSSAAVCAPPRGLRNVRSSPFTKAVWLETTSQPRP